MIRHIVWWTLKDQAQEQKLAEAIERIRQASAMLHGLPSLTSVEVSAKIQPSSTVPAQVALMSTHKTFEDLRQYQEDPVHLRFARLMGELAASRSCLDYSLED